MKAFKNHFLFEFRTGIRDKNLLVMNYLFPLGFFALIASLMGSVNPRFIEILIPSMIVASILISTLLGIPDPFVKSREAGVFRSYKINGVPATSIVMIPPITTVLHMIIVAAIITPTAFLIFNAPLPTNWIGFILIFFLTAFAFSGLGVLIGIVSSSSRAIILWSQLIFIPSMIIGGIITSSDSLPFTFRKIGMILPSTHAVHLFKVFAYGRIADFNPLWSIFILLLGGILSFGFAIYLFNWDNQNKTRRGHPAFGFIAMLPYIIGVLFLP